MSQNSPIGSPRSFCINVLFNSDHQPRMLTATRQGTSVWAMPISRTTVPKFGKGRVADNTPTILSHPLNRLTKSNPAAVEAIIAPTHDPHLWHETRSL